MSDSPRHTFVRTAWLEEPDLVGATWWHEGMRIEPVGRRAALVVLAAGVVMSGGFVALMVHEARRSQTPSSSDVDVTTKGSLDAQKQLGWNVGAGTTDLAFDGAVREPFDRAKFDTLYEDLAPTRADLKPYYVATLFQAIAATPTEPAGSEPFRPLRETLTPVLTPAMSRAFTQGRALSVLLQDAPAGTAVFVDLPGTEAVAFAAGLAERLDPVFTFDGWPHPQGVVPAHMTLAAAAYYQPLFAKLRAARGPAAPPVFVLDRGRLLPYDNASDRFDNRYVAKVPSGAQLRALGVTQLFYVSYDGKEADDLNDDFVDYARAGLALHQLDPADLTPEAGLAPLASATAAHASDLAQAPPRSHHTFSRLLVLPLYVPVMRATSFSGHTQPADFGRVGIATAHGTQRYVGTTRSGSWPRAGTGSSGS